MSRTISCNLNKHIDQTVTISGWINNVRAMGKLNFLIIRDRSGFIQVVVESKEEFQKVRYLYPGSIVKIEGQVAKNDQLDSGCEIINPKIIIEVAVNEPPEIEYYKPEIPSDLEFILDNRPISLRNRKIQAVFKIQAEIVHAFRLYMHDEVGAVEFFAPNIIGASSEGGSEFFNVDYFGYQATLAQSSQLYKQMMVGVNERVFGLMPFFRAENSNTTRHLTEGKQFEFEMGFFDHWHEVLDVQEGVMKSIISHLEKVCQPELKVLDVELAKAPVDVKIPRVSFKEALEICFKRNGIDERGESDLSPQAEKELCKYACEEFGTDFIFITDWHTEKRPFYSFPNEKDPSLTNTFDLLCAGSEITSGGQRRHKHDSMVEGIKEKEMDPENFGDYLSIFKGGMPAHGGFGMGLERLTMKLLKLENIREASLFPSDPKRIASNRIRKKMFFGSENVRNEIIRLLKAAEFEFDHKEHEQTPTSEDSARVRGIELSQGVKAIIVRGKKSKKNFQINIPGDERIDMKAVAKIIGEKCEFEDPKVIEERFGLVIGSIPPFGNLLNLETYFDEVLTTQPKVAFNCGLLTESVIMKGEDLVAVVQPTLGDFVKKTAD
ncbi:MAG: aspartate--tRNA(Asn) ligase [Rhabdochlamydiaceae bacterium]|nr:aspartate--tRNA(Asn) ligase [Candidatus Amphrikana amoebophyrae]